MGLTPTLVGTYIGVRDEQEKTHSCYLLIIVSVLLATVAVASYPSGITAFVPQINIPGHTKQATITDSGVLFLP